MSEKTHQLVKMRVSDYEIIKELARKEDRTIQGVISNIIKKYIENQNAPKS